LTGRIGGDTVAIEAMFTTMFKSVAAEVAKQAGVTPSSIKIIFHDEDEVPWTVKIYMHRVYRKKDEYRWAEGYGASIEDAVAGACTDADAWTSSQGWERVR
jgi:hypothetical protein